MASRSGIMPKASAGQNGAFRRRADCAGHDSLPRYRSPCDGRYARATNGDCAGGSIKSACRLVLTEPEDESPYIGSGLLGQHPLKISLASAQSGRWRRTNSEQDSWMVAKVCKWDRNSM